MGQIIKINANAQTIKAVKTSNISAENIKSGVTIKVGDANNAGRIKNVTGTYAGGGFNINSVSNSDGTQTLTITDA